MELSGSLIESTEKMNEGNVSLTFSNPSSERAKIEQMEDSIEKASKRQKLCFEKTSSHIDSIISELKKCKSSLENFQNLLNSSKMEVEGTNENSNSNSNSFFSSQENKPEKRTSSEEEQKYIRQCVGNLVKKVKESDIPNKVSKEHKEVHVAISKIGKNIDKFTPSEISSVYNPSLAFDKNQLNYFVAEHLFREGSFQLAEMFSKEAKLNESLLLKAPFQEMYFILDSIKNKNLEPATEWARKRRTELFSKSNFLEFKFHKTQFIWFLSEKKVDEALGYARKHFSDFAFIELKEIQRLMSSLIYINDLDNSPYKDLISSNILGELIKEFIGTCCSLLGLSFESALHSCVIAGSLALPKQIKAASLLHKSLKGSQIEVELGPNFQFHPIFACPISKEQTTPENPPVLLTCGHVISKTSMQKITRGGNKVKCPYCPTEQKTKDIVEVFF